MNAQSLSSNESGCRNGKTISATKNPAPAAIQTDFEMRRRICIERQGIPSALGGTVAHLDTPTIAEVSCSLSLRGTSGRGRGERGSFHRIIALFRNPLSLLLRRGETESTAGLVVVSRCARFGFNLM